MSTPFIPQSKVQSFVNQDVSGFMYVVYIIDPTYCHIFSRIPMFSFSLKLNQKHI